MSVRHLLVPFIVWSLMAPFAEIARAAEPQVAAPDASAPTAIEQALMERACNITPALALEPDLHQRCLDARLLSMRTDFGRDLSQLSVPERKALDSVCSRVRTAEGREAYLDCLAAQLVSVRSRRSRKNPGAAASPEAAPAVPPASDPITPPPPRQASSRFALWTAAALVTVLVAAGVVLLAVKARRPRRTCRACGVATDSGDLCQTCRHDAAEVLRHAATERANLLRAQNEEQRRLREQEEEQRQQKARQDEDARLRQEDEARQRDEARRQEEDARRRQPEDVGQPVASSAAEALFDPYVILGVPREISQVEIRAAYEQARLKYDPEGVSHLGDEVQAHYRAKAEAVERAYLMLAE